MNKIIRPIIQKDGTISGFLLRPEMLRSMFYDDSYSFNVIHNAVKVCCFMNKVLADGHEMNMDLQVNNEYMEEVEEPMN